MLGATGQGGTAPASAADTANQFLSVISAKALRDLQLDMSLPATKQQPAPHS